MCDLSVYAAACGWHFIINSRAFLFENMSLSPSPPSRAYRNRSALVTGQGCGFKSWIGVGYVASLQALQRSLVLWNDTIVCWQKYKVLIRIRHTRCVLNTSIVVYGGNVPAAETSRDRASLQQEITQFEGLDYSTRSALFRTCTCQRPIYTPTTLILVYSGGVGLAWFAWKLNQLFKLISW